MSGERFRFVYSTPNERHVSPIVLSEDEVYDRLDVEVHLHEITGWTVTRGERLIVCRKGALTRVIEAKHFDPFDDSC